jgi:hypothetical protein
MTDPRDNSEDYISLESVKTFFLRLFKGFFGMLDYLSWLLRKYWLLFLLLIFVTTSIGYVLGHIVTFSGDLTLLVKFNDLTPNTYLEIIDPINELATSRAYERLATELGIKEDEAEQISEISMEKTGKEDVPMDDTVRRPPFLITIKLRSIAYADVIQSAFISYINNGDYIKQLKDGQLAYYHDELSFIDAELRKLDSLKTEYNRSINSAKNPTIYYNAFNPADIYLRSAALMDQKGKVDLWFATQQKAMSLIRAVKLEKVTSKRSFQAIVWGFIIGFLGALLIALYRELRIKIRLIDQQEINQSAGS